MPRLRPSLLLLACLLASGALSAPKGKGHEVVRYGVYMQNARVGSMVTGSADSVYEKKPVQKLEATMEIKTAVLGLPTEQQIRILYLLDPKDHPLLTRMTVSSQGRTSVISARYEPARVVCEVTAGGQK